MLDDTSFQNIHAVRKSPHHQTMIISLQNGYKFRSDSWIEFLGVTALKPQQSSLLGANQQIPRGQSEQRRRLKIFGPICKIVLKLFTVKTKQALWSITQP